jgi:hypothetical protein
LRLGLCPKANFSGHIAAGGAAAGSLVLEELDPDGQRIRESVHWRALVVGDVQRVRGLLYRSVEVGEDLLTTASGWDHRG